MKAESKKFFKLIYSFIIIFILINIIMIVPVNCSSGGSTTAAQPVNGMVATIAKFLMVSAQVIVSGWFVIKFTLNGIGYFTSVAAVDKANNKNKMLWTLFYAVIAYLGLFLFSRALGL